MLSRGAATDPRWPAVFMDQVAIWGQDDLAWGATIAAIGWPRMEPSLSFWFWPPRFGPPADPGPCFPWYLCLAASPADPVTVPIVAIQVTMHLTDRPRWTPARIRAVVEKMANGSSFRFVLEDVLPPPATDVYYATMFQRQREQCRRVEASETARKGVVVKLACDAPEPKYFQNTGWPPGTNLRSDRVLGDGDERHL